MKIGQNKRVLYMKNHIHFPLISLSSSWNEKYFRHKLLRNSKHDFNFFFRKSCCSWIMLKNIVERGRPQMEIWCLRVACWKPKSTILGEWPTWCTISLLCVYFYLQLSTCFEHIVLIIRRDKLFQYQRLYWNNSSLLMISTVCSKHVESCK